MLRNRRLASTFNLKALPRVFRLKAPLPWIPVCYKASIRRTKAPCGALCYPIPSIKSHLIGLSLNGQCRCKHGSQGRMSFGF
jgi:hypothetical protein